MRDEAPHLSMIILHASIVEGQFFLWGERPHESSGTGKPIRKGRLKTRVGIVLPLPYNAGIEQTEVCHDAI